MSINKCKKCGEKYTDSWRKWCKPCQINYLKNNFKNWTSRNEKIDNFIQEKQLKFYRHSDIVFEWIPYNQLNDIKQVGKIVSAIWKNGPLFHDYSDKEKLSYFRFFKLIISDIRTSAIIRKKKQDLLKTMKRKPYKKVVLKCLYNSQNNINELLNEVRNLS
jgi:hypothetical protein